MKTFTVKYELGEDVCFLDKHKITYGSVFSIKIESSINVFVDAYEKDGEETTIRYMVRIKILNKTGESETFIEGSDYKFVDEESLFSSREDLIMSIG